MDGKGMTIIGLILLAIILWLGKGCYKTYEERDDIVIIKLPNQEVDDELVDKIQKALQ